MESSFKKGYDKTVNADGSFLLSFKSRRLLPAAFAIVLPLILYPVSCAVSFPFVGGLTAARNDTLSLPTWNVVSIIVAIVIIAVLFNFFVTTRNQILVKPKEGISFNGKNLPFKDISHIGEMAHPNATKPDGVSFVYAETHGTQVKLSSFVSRALAQAIATEIKQASGKR